MQPAQQLTEMESSQPRRIQTQPAPVSSLSTTSTSDVPCSTMTTATGCKGRRLATDVAAEQAPASNERENKHKKSQPITVHQCRES